MIQLTILFSHPMQTTPLLTFRYSTIPSPIARPQDFTTARVAGEFFVNTLLDNNDPRIPVFLTKAKI